MYKKKKSFILDMHQPAYSNFRCIQNYNNVIFPKSYAYKLEIFHKTLICPPGYVSYYTDSHSKIVYDSSKDSLPSHSAQRKALRIFCIWRTVTVKASRLPQNFVIQHGAMGSLPRFSLKWLRHGLLEHLRNCEWIKRICWVSVSLNLNLSVKAIVTLSLKI